MLIKIRISRRVYVCLYVYGWFSKGTKGNAVR